MKKIITSAFVFASVLCTQAALAYNNIWQQVSSTNVPSKGAQVMHPTKFLAYTLNEEYLKGVLWNLSTDPLHGAVIELPMPDGSFRSFNVWQTPMLPAALAAKYSDIKTFTATQVGNQSITAKLDFTVYGFHAMIFDNVNGTAFIDPYSNAADGVYMCHYKSDEVKAYNERMKCLYKTPGEISTPVGEAMDIDQTTLPKLTSIAARTVNAYQLRTYRLALACSHQYAVAATLTALPTKAQAFSKMTTSMNRINGVYEREFSITMTFVANEDTLIFVTATGDPYSADNANADNLLGDNQTVCDARIGNANYDIGHVFTTAGGGLSDLGCVCIAGSKAESETGGSSPTGDGYDIDYVAHEMGHEFGANHTFNDNQNGSCSGNANQSTAYEPGSGSTIMAYGGICDPDDIQPHSDPYFHSASLIEIINYTTASNGNTCPVKTATNNYLVNLGNYTASYTIPYKTPFELAGQYAADSTTDTAITYCWDQWNLGDYGKTLANTHKKGPIFRSYNPVYGVKRVFPKVPLVLSGALSDVGTEDAQGEKAADTARFLTFRMAVRAIINGLGSVTYPDDTVHLDVVSTGTTGGYAGFKVTAPATAVNLTGGSAENVTWNVVGTNAAPVSCDSVNIYVSTDGGYDWPYFVGRYANNGSASIATPNVATTSTARIKVKGAGNVFFNVNATNFAITYNSSIPLDTANNGDTTVVISSPTDTTTDTTTIGVATINFAKNVSVYPIPATDIVHIALAGNSILQANISNELGQIMWKGNIARQADIEVKNWAKGIYYLLLTDDKNTQRTVKTFIVQ